MIVLTGDIGGLLPCCSDCRVDVDHEVPLLGHLRVSRFDLRHDPFGERLSNEGVRHVHDPLLRQLLHLLLDGHVPDEVVVVADLTEDVVDGEAVVLWYGEVLDGAAIDELLLAADDVLEKAERVLV